MSGLKFLTTPGREAYAFPLLIRHLLGDVAKQTSAEIVSGDVRLSYAQLTERVVRLASLLQARGVKPGDTVAVMDWDSHRYLECYFAIPMMGAVLQTVNVRLAHAQIEFTVRQSGASVLLVHSDFKPISDVLVQELSQIRECITLGNESSDDDYETYLRNTKPTFEFEDFDENAVATTFHTTGTTGDPKQVFFTHRQLVLHTLALAATLASQPEQQGLRRSDVYMPITPMFHVHAWGFPYVATTLGMKQVYPGRYDAQALLKLKHDEQVTLSHCVPTLLRMLLDANDGSPLTPWTIIIGGSALPPALAEEASTAGITTLSGFGMSETGPVISLARQEGGAGPSLCRAGYPLPLTYTRVRSDRGGELVLRAPWLTQGYGSQDASDELWEGGWLHTGDVVEIDDDGCLRIVDRLKDVVKTGGEWVSSIDVETRLMEHQSVAEAAVVGVPDERWGERPVAFVTRARGAEVMDTAELQEHLRVQAASGQISRFAIPGRITELDALPRTSVGKVDKKLLRTMALAEEVGVSS